MSFRLKTILGIALIESILLTIIVFSSVHFLRDASLDDMVQQGRTTSALFVAATKDAVLSLDLASLNSSVEELLENPQVRYVRIFDHSRMLVADGDPESLSAPFFPETGYVLPKDGVYDIEMPIIEEGYNFGRLEIGFDVRSIEQRLNAAGLSVGAIALMELLLCALFSLLLGTYLTRQLVSLQQGSAELATGNLGFQVRVEGRDELAQAASAFNDMSSRLAMLAADSEIQHRIIREREALFSALLHAMPSGVLLADSSGTVAYTNMALFRLLDLPPCSNTVCEDIRTLMPHLSESFVRKEAFLVFVSSVLTRKKRVANYEMQLKQGGTLEIDYLPVSLGEAGPQYHLWYFRDVSDRKYHEQIISRRSTELTAVFNLSPDGLISFDRHGRIQMVNDACCRLTGMSGEDLQGANMSEFDHRLRQKLQQGCELPLVDYTQTQEMHTDLVTVSVNGLTYLERVICFERDDQWVGGTVYFRDISQQKKLEVMKSEFLSTAAHELRTPMASVYGYSELLLNASFDDATRRDMLGIIHAQVGRLVAILNDLLDLARIEAKGAGELQRSQQALDAIIAEAAALQGGGHSGHHILTTHLAEVDPVCCDRDKVAQVLNNILNNAIKYSPDGGAVSVRLWPERRGDLPGAAVCISDQGIGMTPEECSMIFERFYRADQSGAIPGTGLGMSIVKEIIELHNGELSVESTKGRGTAVTFWLPLS
jgi:PAS domain S-box-containing protein